MRKRLELNYGSFCAHHKAMKDRIKYIAKFLFVGLLILMTTFDRKKTDQELSIVEII